MVDSNHDPVTGRFTKGNVVRGGRPKGAVAKTPAFIRQAMIEGPARVGSDGKGTGDFEGYCEQAAREAANRNDRASYLKLVSPLVGRSKEDGEGNDISTIINVNVNSIPTNHYVVTEVEARRLRGLDPDPPKLTVVDDPDNDTDDVA
jgi:hypothetical protein